MGDQILKIKRNDLKKESGATLVFTFFLPISIGAQILLKVFPAFGFYFFITVTVILLLIVKLYFRNQKVIVLSPDFIQFANLDKGLFFSWVKAKWEEVTRIQTYETLENKIMAVKNKKAFGGALWGNELITAEGFLLATKIFVRVGNDSEEKAIIVPMSNEYYGELLNYLKSKVEIEKTDETTRKLFNPKFLMDEMIKRHKFLS